MACLLYCITLANADSLSNLVGVAGQPVIAHDSADLRVYWSQVANPETLVEGASRKPAELRYQQVLREAAMRTTALAFPFASVVEDVESIDASVAEQKEIYVEALTRLADTIQVRTDGNVE